MSADTDFLQRQHTGQPRQRASADTCGSCENHVRVHTNPATFAGASTTCVRQPRHAAWSVEPHLCRRYPAGIARAPQSVRIPPDQQHRREAVPGVAERPTHLCGLRPGPGRRQQRPTPKRHVPQERSTLPPVRAPLCANVCKALATDSTTTPKQPACEAHNGARNTLVGWKRSAATVNADPSATSRPGPTRRHADAQADRTPRVAATALLDR